MNNFINNIYKDRVINKLNSLFITYRKRHLEQYKTQEGDSHYRTAKQVLTDGKLVTHLKGNKTIGVLLGEGGLTKFMTFDVDIEDDPAECQRVTLALVELLRDFYGIEKEEIHVSTSGHKGYHVDLYFDDVIPQARLIPFYLEVLQKLNETPTRIERRPTSGQGAKLPLGKHQKTGKWCQYVDNETLKPVGIEYFLNIVPMSKQEFVDTVLADCKLIQELRKPEADSRATLKLKETKMNIRFHPDGMSPDEVAGILEVGHLLREGTRNNFTLYGAMDLKSEGYSRSEVVEKIQAVIEWTMRNEETKSFVNSSLTHAKSEVERIVSVVFDRDYKREKRTFGTKIKLYEHEIHTIMQLKKTHLVRLAFAMLIHSKIYANEEGVFYCTYNQLGSQEIDTNRSRTRTKIAELEKAGLVKVIRANAKYSMATKKREPNLYRLTFPNNVGDEFIEIEAKGSLSLTEISKKFISLSEWERDYIKKAKPVYRFKD